MNLLPENIQNDRVLVAALDWGMGHVTRCISLFRQFIAQGNTVCFAGNEFQVEFLQREFPEIHCFALDGYNVRLDARKNTYFQMLSQAFKLKGAESREHQWLNEHLKSHHYGYILSDNRYGFYSETTPSIMLTHQLRLQLPAFSKQSSDLIQKKVNRFAACWVPDNASNLSGELSSAQLEIPIHRIGLLNRFQPIECEKDIPCLAILSGPEPSRSQFEEKCAAYLMRKFDSSVMVGSQQNYASIQTVSNPSTQELGKLIARSELVLSRAGYTTIMEMIALNQKALLIPTPGQFEQEYLAKVVSSPHIQFFKESELF